MENFVIIPDSSCDLSRELRQQLDIPEYLHGVIYFPDGHNEPADLDWGSIDPDTYFSSMADRKTLYKTATPPSGETYEVFERYLAQGQDVLSISLSSGLSSSHADTVSVARELMQRYPERRIICVDSLRYSGSLALLVIAACRKRLAGCSLTETAEYTEMLKHRIHQAGFMDDLFFLVKTGRISNFKAFFGSLVGVNVLADINEKGLSEVTGKCKGKRTTLEASVRYMERTAVEPREQTMVLVHSLRPQAAEALAAMVKERLAPKELICTRVGMSCGANIGPGLCGVYYVGEPISPGNEKEQAVIRDILAELKQK